MVIYWKETRNKMVTDSQISNKITDYCGNYIYENSKLSRLMFDGGFYTFDSDSLNPECHYFFTDHLGSVRVVTDAQGNIEQTNNYYPYGGLMASSSTIYSPSSSTAANQPNRYNGKELDRRNNLDWHDYGARYFAGHGQWTSIDPLAEKYYDWSPYVYCIGNPIKFVDPDGEDVWIFYIDNKGKENVFHFNGEANVTHTNSFVNEFLQAYYYLNEHNAGDNLKKIVTNPKYKTTITQTNKKSYTGSFRGVASVWWNSKMGIYTTEGGRQSPALQLEHEFGHALSRLTDLHNHLARERQYDPQYDNAEERRVTTGSERRSAKRLGESIRYNHKGTLYRTKGVTSTIPYVEKKK